MAFDGKELNQINGQDILDLLTRRVPEDITLLGMGYLTYLPLADGSPRPHASLSLAVAVGFVGCMVGDGIMFGKAAVKQMLRENRDQPADVILNSVFEAVASHAGETKIADDMTLIVVKIAALKNNH